MPVAQPGRGTATYGWVILEKQTWVISRKRRSRKRGWILFGGGLTSVFDSGSSRTCALRERSFASVGSGRHEMDKAAVRELIALHASRERANYSTVCPRHVLDVPATQR